MMRLWHDFLDSIDTNGGHILILIFLILLGALANRNGFVKAEDIVMGAFGALLLALKDSGSNQDRRDTATTVTKVETHETEPQDRPQVTTEVKP